MELASLADGLHVGAQDTPRSVASHNTGRTPVPSFRNGPIGPVQEDGTVRNGSEVDQLLGGGLGLVEIGRVGACGEVLPASVANDEHDRAGLDLASHLRSTR